MQRDKVTYFVKRPGKERASFSIVKRTVSADGKKRHEVVKSESLVAINRAISTLGLNAADIQVKALCDQLNKDEKKSLGAYVANEENQKLLAKYWKDVYEHRKIIGMEQAYNRLRAAVDLLGPRSLLSERSALQKHVDTVTRGKPRKQRRTVAVLNQIRRHFRIEEKLAAEREVLPDFRYLTETEFEKVSLYLQGTEALLFRVLFYSGIRTGEAMAVKSENYRGGMLLVDSQITRKGDRAATKTNTVRRTAVLPGGQDAMAEWLKLPLSERDKYCRNSLSRLIRKACKLAHPKDPTKWLCVHDLRHSFAVMVLLQGSPIDTVAKLLGNSSAVCEKYYLRFILSDETVSSVLNRARQSG